MNVDLEKEIKDTCRSYRINDYHDQELGKHDIESIAHYFYELGLNAKESKCLVKEVEVEDFGDGATIKMPGERELDSIGLGPGDKAIIKIYKKDE